MDESELEALWGELLSQEAARIAAAWVSLAEDERVAVRLHLQRMVTEEGWLDAQRASASAALDALRPYDAE